ncbi:tetratricopeptide repeat protein [Sphingomonas sp. CJ20]
MFFLLLTLQTVPAVAEGTAKEPARFAECMDLATGDPSSGVQNATRWRAEGGGMLARQCLGVSYANQKRWESAAGAFEEAAHDAETAKDAGRGANYWAQAGNAWLAAGNIAKARADLDAALASGALTGLALGEAHLDRARVLVAAGDTTGARADIDAALRDAANDPLAWLLSATLARRASDLERARTDIAQAVKLAPDDASVQLEAGNVAAASGDEAGARAAWTRVGTLAPGTPLATAANGALAQFGTTGN